MTWPMILAALCALCLAHLVRAPKAGRRAVAPAAFVIGLVVAAIGVRTSADLFQIKRPDAYDGFLAHATASAKTEPQAPILLFVGTSYTRNALDDERLTESLRRAGLPHLAINYSLEGASYQERFLRLSDLLKALPRAPDAVFLEVADKYDLRPAYAFKVGKLSNRSIGQFGPASAGWTALGISQGACPGLKDCALDLAYLGVHTGLNALNVGLLSVARPIGGGEPAGSFDPVTTVRTPVPIAEREAGLLARPLLNRTAGPTWARSYRRLKATLLQDAGVTRVGYYLPPVISDAKRSYVSGLCAGELADAPCIAPDDPALLARLNADVWFDAEHLLAPGAEIYTDWLAERLIHFLVDTPPRAGVDVAEAEAARP